MKPFLFSSLLIFGGVYAVMAGWLYFNQRGILYIPYTAQPSPAEAGLPDMEVVEYQTADGLSLYGWYQQAVGDKPTIVYFHGNAGNLLNHSWIAGPLIEAGYGVLLVEYRGYGGNPGKPTEDGLYADGRAAIEFLKGAGINENGLVFFGQSLGTGIAVKMAIEYSPKALILQSPYTSIAKAGQHHYWYLPVLWLIKDKFPSDERIGDVAAPLLVLIAEHDTIIPPKMSRQLFALANQPKTLKELVNSGHNDLSGNGGMKAVLEFLGKLQII